MSQQDYTSLTSRFETYLSAHQPYGVPDTLYEPIRYINDLGGKRIRPVLLLMAYNLWHEDVTPALPAALAVEYFHNFSLMHDDIMDEAPLRRGKPTVHIAYGRNSAILSGDALLIRCFDVLLEAGRHRGISADLCSCMCKASLEICEGQQMDMDFEKREAPTESEYLEMIRKKTACLIGVSLQLGAMLAGASQTEVSALYRFGEQLGLGFQIQDDYLDIYGDAARTGKQQGGDILQGKKNFPFVHTYNTISPSDRIQFLNDCVLACHQADIKPVIRWYEQVDMAHYMLDIQSRFLASSMEELDQLSDSDSSRLQDLAIRLMVRDH